MHLLLNHLTISDNNITSLENHLKPAGKKKNEYKWEDQEAEDKGRTESKYITDVIFKKQKDTIKTGEEKK